MPLQRSERPGRGRRAQPMRLPWSPGLLGRDGPHTQQDYGERYGARHGSLLPVTFLERYGGRNSSVISEDRN
eukprot:553329-Prymnesium_polylepis.1